MVLLVESSQVDDDHASLIRVCHDFDASSVGDLALAIEHASKSAQRQLRHHAGGFRRERDVQQRRRAIHGLSSPEIAGLSDVDEAAPEAVG
jgi:hypothetical protein